jgi:hypothetical protein
MLKVDSFAKRVPPAIWQYALAVVSVAVALAITDALEPYTTLRTPLFYIAIISSAWFGGMGPGLLALALSTLAVEYYFAPTASGPELGTDGGPFILLFSLSGLLACWISVQRRRADGKHSGGHGAGAYPANFAGDWRDCGRPGWGGAAARIEAYDASLQNGKTWNLAKIHLINRETRSQRASGRVGL